MGTSSADVLLPTVSKIVAHEGVDLEDLQVVQQGRRRIVRVVVDADDGVDIDRCADISRVLTRSLDDSGVMGESPYTLEVGSRGVSRPLTAPRHWRRNEGRLVKVTPYEGDPYFGRIVSSDDDTVSLDIDGTERDLPFSTIRRAKVQVEFGSSPDDSEEG